MNVKVTKEMFKNFDKLPKSLLNLTLELQYYL